VGSCICPVIRLRFHEPCCAMNATTLYWGGSRLDS
jgi:hypothetical protein